MYSIFNKENYRLTQVCIHILKYRITNRELYKFVVSKLNKFIWLLSKWQVISVSNISLAHLAYLFTYFTLFFATFLHGFVCLLPWILCTVANVWIILISIDHIWVQFYSYACGHNHLCVKTCRECTRGSRIQSSTECVQLSRINV